MMNFTNQPAKTAIVPLQVGGLGLWNPPRYGQFDVQRRPEGAQNFHDQWFAIWGTYSFTNAAGDRLTVEGSGLLQQYMHDFCGGNVGSSFGVYVHSLRPSLWGSDMRPLSTKGAPGFTDWNEPNYTSLPCLKDALRPSDWENGISAEVAEDIMSRSLMFWTFGYLFSRGRRGMVGVDRYKARPHSRHVWRYGPKIRRAPGFVLWHEGGRMSPRDQAGDPTRTVPEFETYTDFAPHCAWSTPNKACTYKVSANFDEGNPWLNRNSGHEVSWMSLNLSFPKADSGSDFEDEEYDPETDTYKPKAIPASAQLVIPDWFTERASRIGYFRMFPRMLFNAG